MKPIIRRKERCDQCGSRHIRGKRKRHRYEIGFEIYAEGYLKCVCQRCGWKWNERLPEDEGGWSPEDEGGLE